MMLLIILFVALSIALHELAHIVAAKKVGWNFKGIRFKWYGIKIILEQNNNKEFVWIIAYAGLITTLYLSLIFFIIGAFYPRKVIQPDLFGE